MDKDSVVISALTQHHLNRGGEATAIALERYE